MAKKYGAIQALKGISFSIGKGEIVGFLGPNGAGKSTTLRILSGLIPADSGEAKVCGVDLAEEEGEVRRHVGYLAENNPLPEDLRVVEYLDFRAKLKGLGGSRKRERIRIVLDICDLERKVSERKIGNLSKGFRQRVGIADSLLAEPRLVILDEPTIGLDPRQSAITRKMMERSRGEVSFLLSSHILSEVEACCDRMIILSHGQIVAEGTLLDLQKEFINSTVFEIVAFGNRIDIQRVIRKIDDTCELIQDDPVEVTGKRGSLSPRKKGVSSRKAFSSNSLKSINSGCPNFKSQTRLGNDILRATKKNWEDQDFLGRNKKRPKIVGEKTNESMPCVNTL